MNLATLNHCNGLPSNIWVLYSAIHQLPTITFITAQSITCSLFLDNVSCAFILFLIIISLHYEEIFIAGSSVSSFCYQ